METASEKPVNIKHMDITRPKKFRVLALDGGGVRALLEVLLLKRLVEVYPNFLSEVDMIAGTSAGAIIALALASGGSPSDVADTYIKVAPDIFTENFAAKVSSMYNTIAAAFRADKLKEMATMQVGDKTLADIKKYKLLVPSFKLASPIDPCCEESVLQEVHNLRWKPEFFHNFDNSPNADTKLVDVILRTAAAPTYFPIYQGYIDGGLFANNPSLCAVSAAINAGIKLEDISVLSLSTGYNPQALTAPEYGAGNWGMYQWSGYLMNLFFDSGSEAIDMQCRSILRSRYHRLDPSLPKRIDLSDASSIPILEDIASKLDLSATKSWLEEFWLPPHNCQEEDGVEVISQIRSAPKGPSYCSIQ